MQGKKVLIHLFTPIMVQAPMGEGKESKPRTVHKLTGVVLDSSDAGITLEVSEGRDEKDQKVLPAHRKIFLPHHKIDHVELSL